MTKPRSGDLRVEVVVYYLEPLAHRSELSWSKLGLLQTSKMVSWHCECA